MGYTRQELTDAYVRHLFDKFEIDLGLFKSGDDLNLNFEDFDECINSTPEEQRTIENYKWTIEDFVDRHMEGYSWA